jgi:PAS domain S-box-containing protein
VHFHALLNSHDWGKIPARVTLSVTDPAHSGTLIAVITDLSEQIRYQEIVKEEKLSRSIMENSPVGIAVCDLKGIAIRSSGALSQFCKSSVLMKPFDRVFCIEIPMGEGKTQVFSVRDVLAGKPQLDTEARLYRSGTESRDISFSAVPLMDDIRTIVGCLIIMTDITDRKKAEEVLRENQALLRTVMNSTTDPIYVKDCESRILLTNRALAKVVGKPVEEIIGRTDAEYYGNTAVGQMIREHDLSVMASGRSETMEETVPTIEGNRVFISNKAPFRNAAGDIIGIIGISRDITDRKHAEDALKEQAQQLEEANRELENFSYSVSHDLKSPIRAIDGYSRMILKKYGDQVGEDAARMLGVIRTSTERMVRLIDDLLAFSRVLRNTMTIVEIDMNKLASEVWEDTQAMRQDREIEVKIAKLQSGFGDRGLIRQVLFNLISNAVKFTRGKTPGVIEMSCYTEPGQIVYVLKDNGVGFDMAYYDKLFNVFQRLHSESEFEGTGAGLAIVSRIIKRHGGRVWAEGELDKGARFYFSLPIKSN